jgi:hypothetical protein
MIKKFNISTGMGKCFDRLDFLTDNQFREFNNIGGSGKNSNGVRTTREVYLNTLGIGEFSVTQTKFDSGDFSESFLIIFVPNEGTVEVNPRPQPLDDKDMDFTAIINIAKEYIQCVWDDEYMKDHTQWFFEEGLEAVYGKGIFDKVNEMT